MGAAESLGTQAGASATASRPSSLTHSTPGERTPARTSESAHASLSSRRRDSARPSTGSCQTPLQPQASLPPPSAAKSCLKSKPFSLSLGDLEQLLRASNAHKLGPRRVSFSDLTEPYAVKTVSRRALDQSGPLRWPPAYWLTVIGATGVQNRLSPANPASIPSRAHKPPCLSSRPSSMG